ncbi:hypothetical protein LGH70_07695 [Hymenobacter sp. BT635]|uniref:DUF4274 domain-containing protein n=1 Tax=Hymenobacter nitidus TaxID=2880929 RepID=A0ABS8ABB6_9BACT|nr:hypothetical protein [Hymenobacter nitidus]MCB2377459.1 hypothetical protein [Hymenobacter nitidus]
MMEDDRYPEWLADKLLNVTFDWNAARKISISDFFECVSLHDSSWYGTSMDRGNAIIWVIHLDAIWNKDFCHILEDWPFLIIRIQNVLSTFQDFTSYDGFYSTISSAATKPVNIPDFKEWVDFSKVAELFPADFYQRLSHISDLNRTDIETIYGGSLTVIHQPMVELLLYTEQGIPLAINFPI